MTQQLAQKKYVSQTAFFKSARHAEYIASPNVPAPYLYRMLQPILFALLLVAAFGFFAWQVRKIRANILVGRDRDMSGNAAERFQKTLLVAFGQQKMFKRMTPALLHLVVYVGFLVINIEVLEIVVDGLFGTHRFLSFLGPVYSGLMATNEVLGALVIVAVAAFWWRRNSSPPLKRFTGVELRAWPKLDANIILYVEVILMVALFTMNAADLKLHQLRGETLPGAFPISSLLTGLFPSNEGTLHLLERVGWWAHITGILLFLNYLPSSKHFHIILAFPNVWYSRLVPQGQFSNVDSITNEVRAMMDPSFVVPPAPTAPDGSAAAARALRRQGRGRPALDQPAERLLLHRVRPLHLGVPGQPDGQAALAAQNHHGHARPDGGEV